MKFMTHRATTLALSSRFRHKGNGTKWSGRKIGRGVLIYLLALLVAIQTLLPFAWMVISSVSTNRELLSVPPNWIPKEPTLGTYQALLSGSAISYRGTGEVSAPIQAFGRALLNSFVIATFTTIICLIFGTLSAFAFSRFKFRFKNHLFLLILAVQMIPSISLAIPLYLLMQRMNLTDSYFGLILVYSTFTIAFVIWVMTGYLRSIPRELEEAARVDGGTRFQSLWQIILPLARPGLIATGALAFLTAWNEFLFALLLTNTMSAKTLPVVISEFSTQFSLEYGLMMTGGVLASLPPILLALIFQRHILAGLTAGGVKG